MMGNGPADVMRTAGDASAAGVIARTEVALNHSIASGMPAGDLLKEAAR